MSVRKVSGYEYQQVGRLGIATAHTPLHTHTHTLTTNLLCNSGTCGPTCSPAGVLLLTLPPHLKVRPLSSLYMFNHPQPPSTPAGNLCHPSTAAGTPCPASIPKGTPLSCLHTCRVSNLSPHLQVPPTSVPPSLLSSLPTIS